MKLERRITHAPELTPEQIREICEKCQKEGLPKEGLGWEYRPAFSNRLTGKQFTFRFQDYTDLTYRINGPEELQWSLDGAVFQKEYCQILESAENSNLFFVHHLRSFTFPLEAMMLVIDLDNGLTTLVHSTLGDFKRPREVDRTFHFGYIMQDGEKPPVTLHDFTTEMVGKIIDWHYGNANGQEDFVVRHFHVDHLHEVARLFIAGSYMFFAVTCDYVKVRENVYIMSWVETYGQGVQGCALMDLNTMTDVGSFFGVGYGGTLDSHTFAAKGIPADTICPEY